MANPHRGSVALQAGDKAFTLSYSINAICELEEAMGGRPIAQIAQDLQKPEKMTVTNVRLIVWAGLRDHHTDADLRLAGDVISDAGIQACMEKVAQAFVLAFPDQTGDKPRPTKPRR